MRRGATRPAGSFVVEVLGVAGAGKTTLVAALARRDPAVCVGIPLAQSEKLPLHLRHAFRLLPSYLKHSFDTRWLTVAEIRAMAYVVAWRRRLERRRDTDAVVLLDHGPLFRLATLDEFGPPLTRSEAFRSWRDAVLASWAATLGAVVWLDAPDQVLLARIRSREQGHEVKNAAEGDALQFITRYRAAYARVIRELGALAPVPVLRFSTAGSPLDVTAEEVAQAIAVERGERSGASQKVGAAIGAPAAGAAAQP